MNPPISDALWYPRLRGLSLQLRLESEQLGPSDLHVSMCIQSWHFNLTLRSSQKLPRANIRSVNSSSLGLLRKIQDMKYFIAIAVTLESRYKQFDLVGALQTAFDNGASGFFQTVPVGNDVYTIIFERDASDDAEMVRKRFAEGAETIEKAAKQQLAEELLDGNLDILGLSLHADLYNGAGTVFDFGSGAIQSMAQPTTEESAPDEFIRLPSADGGGYEKFALAPSHMTGVQALEFVNDLIYELNKLDSENDGELPNGNSVGEELEIRLKSAGFKVLPNYQTGVYCSNNWDTYDPNYLLNKAARSQAATV